MDYGLISPQWAKMLSVNERYSRVIRMPPGILPLRARCGNPI